MAIDILPQITGKIGKFQFLEILRNISFFHIDLMKMLKNLYICTARFGQLSTMKNAVRKIGVEKFSPKLKEVNIVFTTLNDAVDLLQ